MAPYRQYDLVTGVTTLTLQVSNAALPQDVGFGYFAGLPFLGGQWDLNPDLFVDAQTVTFGGRQLSLRHQGIGLVDDVIYLLNNPDVRQSGLDAESHYFQFGWKEGRSTGSLFDSSFYLAANPDVQAAGIDPVTHYLEYGWREGRNPSLFFDTNFYLRTQPDVASSGMNPFDHYLQYGRYEGRSPNAIFDAAFYLSENPELAAIQGDPLQDYLEAGWREGRSASESFNTRVYLAMNPDVDLSGMNPLVHYLRYGIDEGRVADSGQPAVIGGSDTGLIRDGAIYATSGRLMVSDPDADQNAIAVDPRTGKAVLSSDFGALTIQADGHWDYQTWSFKQALVALPEGAVAYDTLTVRTVGDDTHQIRIKIIGRNDEPSIFGSHAAQMDETKSRLASGEMRITDYDTGESHFQEGQYSGTYGEISLTSAGAWQYLFTGNAEQGVQPGMPHEPLTDIIEVRTADNTAVAITIDILGLG